MKKISVCVARSAGTNCDKETAFAFSKLGAQAQLVHLNRLLSKNVSLDDYHILALPGGFTYGDDIAAGRIFANELRFKLADSIRKFIDDGKLVIGICNGFQILVKAGLLPGYSGFKQQASLVINDCGSFRAEWVHLKTQCSKDHAQKCIWTKDLPEVIYLPIAHGEGKFVVTDNDLRKQLHDNGQIVFQYCNQNGAIKGYPYNPNGSLDNIAGICDPTGRILGLMPHPERHFLALTHPHRWQQPADGFGDGYWIFANAVNYAQKSL